MIDIRKFLAFILCFVLMCGVLLTPANTHAAGASSAAGAVTVSAGRLNVRSGASTSATVLTTLPKGGYITLLSKSGNWWQVEYAKGKTGYCHADYITAVEGDPVTVNIGSGTLNVRSGAGTGYSRIGALQKGETVLLLSTTGDWSRILYHGTKTGYVSSRYLSGAGAGYKSIALSVPGYKQTDSRWSGVKIGSSGGTIGTIGCATTAIAMVESYRTGSTITPADMVKKLKYTAGGSVYWPDHYTAVSGSGYLQGIYNQLKSGKPVLFGAKNRYGGQHWVVITGYTGGDTLTASGFTINDPGTNTRTTLQHLLNAYPTFYKYMTY